MKRSLRRGKNSLARLLVVTSAVAMVQAETPNAGRITSEIYKALKNQDQAKVDALYADLVTEVEKGNAGPASLMQVQDAINKAGLQAPAGRNALAQEVQSLRNDLQATMQRARVAQGNGVAVQQQLQRQLQALQQQVAQSQLNAQQVASARDELVRLNAELEQQLEQARAAQPGAGEAQTLKEEIRSLREELKEAQEAQKALVIDNVDVEAGRALEQQLADLEQQLKQRNLDAQRVEEARQNLERINEELQARLDAQVKRSEEKAQRAPLDLTSYAFQFNAQPWYENLQKMKIEGTPLVGPGGEDLRPRVLAFLAQNEADVPTQFPTIEALDNALKTYYFLREALSHLGKGWFGGTRSLLDAQGIVKQGELKGTYTGADGRIHINEDLPHFNRLHQALLATFENEMDRLAYVRKIEHLRDKSGSFTSMEEIDQLDPVWKAPLHDIVEAYRYAFGADAFNKGLGVSISERTYDAYEELYQAVNLIKTAQRLSSADLTPEQKEASWKAIQEVIKDGAANFINLETGLPQLEMTQVDFNQYPNLGFIEAFFDLVSERDSVLYNPALASWFNFKLEVKKGAKPDDLLRNMGRAEVEALRRYAAEEKDRNLRAIENHAKAIAKQQAVATDLVDQFRSARDKASFVYRLNSDERAALLEELKDTPDAPKLQAIIEEVNNLREPQNEDVRVAWKDLQENAVEEGAPYASITDYINDLNDETKLISLQQGVLEVPLYQVQLSPAQRAELSQALQRRISALRTQQPAPEVAPDATPEERAYSDFERKIIDAKNDDIEGYFDSLPAEQLVALKKALPAKMPEASAQRFARIIDAELKRRGRDLEGNVISAQPVEEPQSAETPSAPEVSQISPEVREYLSIPLKEKNAYLDALTVDGLKALRQGVAASAPRVWDRYNPAKGAAGKSGLIRILDARIAKKQAEQAAVSEPVVQPVEPQPAEPMYPSLPTWEEPVIPGSAAVNVEALTVDNVGEKLPTPQLQLQAINAIAGSSLDLKQKQALIEQIGNLDSADQAVMTLSMQKGAELAAQLNKKE